LAGTIQEPFRGFNPKGNAASEAQCAAFPGSGAGTGGCEIRSIQAMPKAERMNTVW
jgi:hypothetical protein